MQNVPPSAIFEYKISQPFDAERRLDAYKLELLFGMEGVLVSVDNVQKRMFLGPFSIRRSCPATPSVPEALYSAIACLVIQDCGKKPRVTYEVIDTVRALLQRRLASETAAARDAGTTHHEVLAILRDAIEEVAHTRPGRTHELLPYQLSVHVVEGVLTTEQCALIIAQADEHGERFGWTYRRHVAHPTTDLPVSSVPALQWLPPLLINTLLPQMASLFQLKVNALHLDDLFVAAYSADSERPGLGEHEDGTPWSFVLSLSDSTSFEGGGTLFPHLEGRPTFQPSRGSAVVFSGSHRHAGRPVTRGRRIILAGFCAYAED
mmetsp:Transcript_14343/g.33707  ORF Transcript_14343/g.33707 Transcript_14343/m.33707 type:complete len:320 (+) Transcript_14343:19-978(+)